MCGKPCVSRTVPRCGEREKSHAAVGVSECWHRRTISFVLAIMSVRSKGEPGVLAARDVDNPTPQCSVHLGSTTRAPASGTQDAGSVASHIAGTLLTHRQGR
jgi:hypothetical protein